MEKNNRGADYYNNLPPSGTGGGFSKLRQQMSKGLGVFTIIAASIAFYFVFLRVTDVYSGVETVIRILKPIMYGLVIAYLLNPIVIRVEDWLSTKLDNKIKSKKRLASISRSLGIVTALVLLLWLIFLLINLILPELFSSVQNVIVNLPDQLNELVLRVNRLASENDTFSDILADALNEATQYVRNWVQTDLLTQINDLMSGLTVGVIAIIKELFNIIMGMIVSIYVMYSRETFGAQCKKVIYAVFPIESANMTLHIAKKSNQIFGGFVIGKIIDSMIIGIIAFVVLSILNMPYTLLVSVIVGVTNVIPFFGPYIGAVPCTILIFLQEPIMGVYFVIFIIILQQIDGNIIGPKILGDSTGLSSFWVIFAILLGGGLMGFVGMIIGVPTFAVIYYICQVIINQKLEKKELPTDTQKYREGSYVDTVTRKYVEK